MGPACYSKTSIEYLVVVALRLDEVDSWASDSQSADGF